MFLQHKPIHRLCGSVCIVKHKKQLSFKNNYKLLILSSDIAHVNRNHIVNYLVSFVLLLSKYMPII